MIRPVPSPISASVIRLALSIAALGLVSPATAAPTTQNATPPEQNGDAWMGPMQPPPTMRPIALPGLRPDTAALAAPDLDLLYIERTPRFGWDQPKTGPAIGEVVTFTGHLANRGDQAVGAFGYAWSIDGVPAGSGSLGSLSAGQETTVSLTWSWQTGAHSVRLVLDPAGSIAESSETNNALEDRTNGLALGIWVEQSFYDFFNQHVAASGWGGNSFEDWIQRHVQIWNQMMAAAQYPIAPTGILDRVRLDKVVRVPNGGLHCETNWPADDTEVDLMWGFPSEQVGVASSANCTWWTPRYRDDAGTWDRDMSLIHELNHARYHIDLYGFNLDAHPQSLAASLTAADTALTFVSLPDILEFRPPAAVIVDGEIIQCVGRSGSTLTSCVRGAQGTTARVHAAGATVYGDQIRLQDGEGNALVGSAALPIQGGAFHRGVDFGWDIMNAGVNYGEYSAYVWNRIAGQRPGCGNSNAPCNLGAFLQELPASNVIELRDSNGALLPEAWIDIYRAKPFAIWYGKTYEGAPDQTVITDAAGRADLGSQPFGPGGVVHTYGQSNGVLALRIRVGQRVGVQFLEVTSFNLEYGRGHTGQGIYPVTLSTWTTVSTALTIERLFLPNLQHP